MRDILRKTFARLNQRFARDDVEWYERVTVRCRLRYSSVNTEVRNILGYFSYFAWNRGIFISIINWIYRLHFLLSLIVSPNDDRFFNKIVILCSIIYQIHMYQIHTCIALKLNFKIHYISFETLMTHIYSYRNAISLCRMLIGASAWSVDTIRILFVEICISYRRTSKYSP